MSIASISVTSGPQYFYVPGVKAFAASSADAANPTSLPVKVAIVAEDTAPTAGQWLTAEWDPTVTASPYTVRYLLNPSTYTAGTLSDVWLEVLGAVEQPAAKVGQIRFGT